MKERRRVRLGRLAGGLLAVIVGVLALQAAFFVVVIGGSGKSAAAGSSAVVVYGGGPERGKAGIRIAGEIKAGMVVVSGSKGDAKGRMPHGCRLRIVEGAYTT